MYLGACWAGVGVREAAVFERHDSVSREEGELLLLVSAYRGDRRGPVPSDAYQM